MSVVAREQPSIYRQPRIYRAQGDCVVALVMHTMCRIIIVVGAVCQKHYEASPVAEGGLDRAK